MTMQLTETADLEKMAAWDAPTEEIPGGEMSTPERRFPELMTAARAADEQARVELRQRIDAALRCLAARRDDGGLDAPELVHAACLDLLAAAAPDWESRLAFYVAAAPLARRVTLDAAHHRRRRAIVHRRAGDLDDSEATLVMPREEEMLIDFDLALDHLEGIEPRLARIVEIRCFAGLTVDEAAAALDISPAAVVTGERRGWTHLRERLSAQAVARWMPGN